MSLGNILKYYFLRASFLALFFHFGLASFAQNSVSDYNYIGFQMIHALNLPYTVSQKSDYAYVKFYPNYHYGVGAAYQFKFKKNYGLSLGFEIENRSITFKSDFDLIKIYNQFNYTITDDDVGFNSYNRIKRFNISLVFQSLNLPILFSYSLPLNENQFITLKTGLNTRYYISSGYEYEYGISKNIATTGYLSPIAFELDVNEKRQFGFDNKTEISYNKILKNNHIWEFAFIANIPIYGVNKGTIVYLKDTPLEQKGTIKVTDWYFGLKIGYWFNLQKNSQLKTKSKIKETENYYLE